MVYNVISCIEIAKNTQTLKIADFRHDICQKIYATAVLEARILHKKHVNRNITQFVTKERNASNWPNLRQKSVNHTF